MLSRQPAPQRAPVCMAANALQESLADGAARLAAGDADAAHAALAQILQAAEDAQSGGPWARHRRLFSLDRACVTRFSPFHPV